ncbi:conserved hypothetical protein [Methylobacterium sp. 4-46]|uniref:hypothetical protein n=1 Tax=unclassified Methylobacterium TaxID=2615210 RepID=UPI000152E30C|nr:MULTISPECIES: hypothetical protein [Methylobacterium]ACA19331.1 conserved hypothetical protein [Methylobacterium sp. 4-46]WFT78531.1 hypothetical protein QA634_25155 [Methylobacterium nodulans]
MADFLTVALICAKTLAGPDCSRDTALDVVIAPAPSPVACMMQGETLAARSNLVDRDTNYLKVSCERRRTASLAPTDSVASRAP